MISHEGVGFTRRRVCHSFIGLKLPVLLPKLFVI
jgi:hypothetical protein